MHQNGKPKKLLDVKLFEENQSRCSVEQLRGFAGRHVAWSLDGTTILASGETFEELADNLHASGLTNEQAIFDYIDPPDAVLI
jgi:hypothetical protein